MKLMIQHIYQLESEFETKLIQLLNRLLVLNYKHKGDSTSIVHSHRQCLCV